MGGWEPSRTHSRLHVRSASLDPCPCCGRVPIVQNPCLRLSALCALAVHWLRWGAGSVELHCKCNAVSGGASATVSEQEPCLFAVLHGLAFHRVPSDHGVHEYNAKVYSIERVPIL